MIQDIGSDILMPIVLERMGRDIVEEDDYDGSSFIESIDFFSDKIFKRSPSLQKVILDILTNKQSEIEGKIGWKLYERIVRKIEEKNQLTTKN